MKLSVSRIVSDIDRMADDLIYCFDHYADWNDFFYIFILF